MVRFSIQKRGSFSLRCQSGFIYWRLSTHVTTMLISSGTRQPFWYVSCPNCLSSTASGYWASTSTDQCGCGSVYHLSIRRSSCSSHHVLFAFGEPECHQLVSVQLQMPTYIYIPLKRPQHSTTSSSVLLIYSQSSLIYGVVYSVIIK